MKLLAVGGLINLLGRVVDEQTRLALLMLRIKIIALGHCKEEVDLTIDPNAHTINFDPSGP